MNYTDIELTEGQRMKFILTISNETDLTNYEIEGYTKGFSRCNCSVKEFEVIEVKNNTVILLTPSLTAGSHGYQVYLTNTNTNQQFKVAEGRIEVTPNYGHETHLSEKYANIEATIYSDTIEMTMTIDKGMQGDKGEKGEKGDQGYSAYDLAVQNGYEGSEEQWVSDFEGAQDAAAEAKNAAAEAKSSETLAEYYYKGSQTNYNNSITEASNATQSANNAASSATQAERYANNAKSSETSAEQQAMNAKSYSNNAASSATSAEQSATQAQTSANNAKSSATLSETYSNNAKSSATQSEQSATSAEEYANSAASSATSAEQSATTAQSLVTTANNTISSAAIKTSNNTFSGTNTFNNVTKVTVAPNSLTSVMNEEASILLDFVQQAGIRTVTSSLSQKAGNATNSETSKQIVVTCPKGDTVSVWEGTLSPLYSANYLNWSAIYIPVYTNMNQKSPYYTDCKFRFIPSFTTNLTGATEEGALGNKLLKQVTDINKPFVNYANVNCASHCAVVEISCEIVNKNHKWTIYNPVDSGGKVQQVKVISFTTASGGFNYANDTGFLFVNVGNKNVKIFFRDFISGFYRWRYCGEVFMMNAFYNSGNYATKIVYAGAGGDNTLNMYLPKEITILPQWSNPFNFTNCQQILQSVTSTDMTETIITLDEYKALQA